MYLALIAWPDYSVPRRSLGLACQILEIGMVQAAVRKMSRSEESAAAVVNDNEDAYDASYDDYSM